MPEPIRVGVIGLGRSGYAIHIDCMRRLGDRFRVVAVTDPLAERATAVAAELGARAHATVDALLADPAVELVVVASPNRLHPDHAVAALKAGKHALVEKPFALRVADVDRMLAAARAAGRVLHPFHQQRYAPDFVKLREVIASGALGRIEFVRMAAHSFKRRWDWQTLTSHDGGELNNNASHLIDQALELFGDGDPEVWCDLRRCLTSGDAEDHVKIVLRGADRPTIEIEMTCVVAFAQERWLVCGTAGGLRGNGDALEWKTVDWSSLPQRQADERPTADRSYNSEQLPWRAERWTAAAPAGGGHGAPPAPQPAHALYLDLHRTLREGAPPAIPAEAMRRRIAVIERCHALCPVPHGATRAATAR